MLGDDEIGSLGQHRGLRDARGAHLTGHDVGRGGYLLSSQLLGGVGEVLQPTFVGELDHAEFPGLHLVAGEDRHRPGGQPGLGKGVVEQGPQVVDVGALVAPHAHH